MNELISSPKLSVLVTAYNLAPYLNQCLDSILSQQVTFRYEILIADDNSTDSTRDIIAHYIKKHPDLIKVFHNPINLGFSRNLCSLIDRANGELIIQIDGDDYITDITKLQQQVDVLDNNKDCAICFHNWVSVDSNGNNPTLNTFRFTGSGVLPEDYLLHHNLGPGNLVMIRRSSLPKPLPNWLPGCANNVDYATHCIAASKGSIYYINKPMTAYRKHEHSITSLAKTKAILEMRIFTVAHIAAYYENCGLTQAASFLKSVLPERYMKLGYFYLSKGDVLNFIRFFLKGFIEQPNFNLKAHKDMIYSSFSPQTILNLKSSFFYRLFTRAENKR